MKVAVIGTGNVGIAIAADLSIRGHEVFLIKASDNKSEAFDRLVNNGNRVFLKEDGVYTETTIMEVTRDHSKISEAEVIIVTIQSTYHYWLYGKISRYLREDQTMLIICSYLSSFYLLRAYQRTHADSFPNIAEATGPYLEGRVELGDKPGEVVFRVGCRLTRSPLSVFYAQAAEQVMAKLKQLYEGLSNDYSVIESALLNPNLVIHTVGAIMSIPRIEYSDGNFCMYREAYSHKNEATLKIMFKLDEEKKDVLFAYGGRRIDILEAGGFLKGMESFYEYSESSDRAVSPTSIHSRYITEDVSQGLVLLESLAKYAHIDVPITTSLIDIASAALGTDFRKVYGRTVRRLGAGRWLKRIAMP